MTEQTGKVQGRYIQGDGRRATVPGGPETWCYIDDMGLFAAGKITDYSNAELCEAMTECVDFVRRYPIQTTPMFFYENITNTARKLENELIARGVDCTCDGETMTVYLS